MPERYTHDQRVEYLRMIDSVGRHWVQVFGGDTEFYSAVYWDLFTGIWRAGGEVRRTDALGLMTRVMSPHTAAKYVDSAIAAGYLERRENKEDARSFLVALTPQTRERLDAFFDDVLDELRLASMRVSEHVLPKLGAAAGRS